MLQRDDDGGPAIVDLPFSPGAGVVWRDRLYLARLPLGLVSWAPGSGVVVEVDTIDHPIAAMFAVEHGLSVVGYSSDANGRLRFDRAYRWQPEGGLVPQSGGAEVVSSAAVAARGWTAEARPDSHTVVFTRSSATIEMVCYAPLVLTWLADSLMVSTADGELLLFKDLAIELDRLVTT
jgi:hypothetical protein